MTKKCGHVAIIGAPNAGKSTLVNALVGQKVAIVSPKAQTTRTRMLGVALAGETQIILVDTPGIFAAQRRLDRAMVAAAWDGAGDADMIALIVDGRAGAGTGPGRRQWLLRLGQEPFRRQPGARAGAGGGCPRTCPGSARGNREARGSIRPARWRTR
jgi:GTPase Era involved in 16S rRNA processing